MVIKKYAKSKQTCRKFAKLCPPPTSSTEFPPLYICCQWRSKLDNWGGIYSCSAQLMSFEIDCFHGL